MVLDPCGGMQSHEREEMSSQRAIPEAKMLRGKDLRDCLYPPSDSWGN